MIDVLSSTACQVVETIETREAPQQCGASFLYSHVRRQAQDDAVDALDRSAALSHQSRLAGARKGAEWSN